MLDTAARSLPEKMPASMIKVHASTRSLGATFPLPLHRANSSCASAKPGVRTRPSSEATNAAVRSNFHVEHGIPAP